MPAYYAKSVQEFLVESPEAIVGKLSIANAKAFHQQLADATQAWEESVSLLQEQLRLARSRDSAVTGWGICLEFDIPRRQRRIDAVLLTGNYGLIIEFKHREPDRAARRQVLTYVQELADFHEPSKAIDLVPIVVSTKRVRTLTEPRTWPDGVISCHIRQLSDFLASANRTSPTQVVVDVVAWNEGAYNPVPPVIEAAQAIFAGMEVREVAHCHAGAENLTSTVDTIIETVLRCHKEKTKAVCFVTGIPGSGKTLAGLRAVHDPRLRLTTGNEATFLSGNGPLVKVLRAALVRDYRLRLRAAKKKPDRTLGALKRYKEVDGPIPQIIEETLKCIQEGLTKERKEEIERKVETLIESVHVFAKTYWRAKRKRVAAPNNHVIVFDEAQRAWSTERNIRKFGRRISEPEMLMRIMERHDWAVIVALVGGGQEINDGEAGLICWGDALLKNRKWQIVAAPEIFQPTVDQRFRFWRSKKRRTDVKEEPKLHLKTATRSIASQKITDWVDAVIAGESTSAREIAAKLQAPPAITRSLLVAKAWLTENSRTVHRTGLVGSAHAHRLRADGLEPAHHFHSEFLWENWFLDDLPDVRSSSKLEVFATQFEIQGLELDWVGVCWGEDFVRGGTAWDVFNFDYVKWNRVADPEKRQYRANGYRVLLTRARRGMVLYVPEPVASDETRMHRALDNTYEFLCQCGAMPVTAKARANAKAEP